MNSVSKSLLLGLALICFNACAAKTPSLLPGQVFRSQFISVQAPASPGWKVVSRQTEIIFRKESPQQNASYVAGVSFVKIPPNTNRPEKLVEYARAQIQRDMPLNRFTPINQNVAIDSTFRYECVRHSQNAYDRGTETPPANARQVRVINIGLMCRHPANPTLAFNAVVSAQSPSLHETTITTLAEEFFRGIEVID